MLDQLPVIATNSRHLASRAGVPALSLVLPWLAAMYACMLACCWARFEWTLGTFGRVSPFESRFPPFCLSKESGDYLTVQVWLLADFCDSIKIFSSIRNAHALDMYKELEGT